MPRKTPRRPQTLPRKRLLHPVIIALNLTAKEASGCFTAADLSAMCVNQVDSSILNHLLFKMTRVFWWPLFKLLNRWLFVVMDSTKILVCTDDTDVLVLDSGQFRDGRQISQRSLKSSFCAHAALILFPTLTWQGAVGYSFKPSFSLQRNIRSSKTTTKREPISSHKTQGREP